MKRSGAGMNSSNYRALLHFNVMPLLRWAKTSSLRAGEQLAVGTTQCSAARLSRLLHRPEREQTRAASRREPQRSRQPSNLTLPGPRHRARPGHLSATDRTPKLAAAAKVAPGRRRRRRAGRRYSPAPGC